MLAYSFLRSQLVTLSGLKNTHLRNLQAKKVITAISTEPYLYSWHTLLICTILRCLREIYDPITCLVMIGQIEVALHRSEISQYDMYYFQSWNKFLLGHQKLTRIDDWENHRWVVRLLSSYDCDRNKPNLKICQRLTEIKITAEGDIVTTRSTDDVLVCVYLRGIFERLLLASSHDPKLHKSIQSFIPT